MKAKTNKNNKVERARNMYLISLFFSVFWCLFLINISGNSDSNKDDSINKYKDSSFKHPVAAIKVENEFKIKRNDN